MTAREIAERLIAFDTTVDEPGETPRAERECQEYVAGLLSAAGFEVDLWEPSVEEMRDHPMYRERQHWDGRPIVVGRLPGTGGGRSLMFNGHIDTVPAGPLSDWTTDPWAPEVRDGRLYGRGACADAACDVNRCALARGAAGKKDDVTGVAPYRRHLVVNQFRVPEIHVLSPADAPRELTFDCHRVVQVIGQTSPGSINVEVHLRGIVAAYEKGAAPRKPANLELPRTNRCILRPRRRGSCEQDQQGKGCSTATNHDHPPQTVFKE